MPVNQPPLNEDAPQMAWYLELVRIINRLEQEIGDLETRVEELENE